MVIVVGVLVGGAMAAAPQRIWWLTESWKFKNPEANEPSDAAYGMTRAGGVFVILLALFVGWSIIDSDFQRKDRREAEQQRKAAEAAFVAPPPQKRGPLPVIGYFTHEFPKGIEITVYYLAPRESVRVAVRDSASHGPFKSSYPCYTSAVWGPATAAPRLVNPELFWAPEELGAVAKSERCHPASVARFTKRHGSSTARCHRRSSPTRPSWIGTEPRSCRRRRATSSRNSPRRCIRTRNRSSGAQAPRNRRLIRVSIADMPRRRSGLINAARPSAV